MPTRLERLKGLLDDHGQDVTDYDEGEEEDPRPYFNGEREVERYACVTVNYSSHGESKFFFLTFPDKAVAMSRAVEFATDDLFEELPIAVVDLDTGDRWTPGPMKVNWHYRKAEVPT